MNSFTAKSLRAEITLADDACTVFSTGGPTLVLENMRVAARVTQNARQATQVDLRIWGMLQQDMDALTVAWLDPEAVRDNKVVLLADNGDGFRQVFQGSIIEAQPDYNRQPDVPLQILGMICYFQQISTAPPLSYKGPTSIDTIGQHLAQALKLSYVNGGTNAVLNSPNFPGSVFDQLRAACEAANVDFYFQGQTLVLTPVQAPLSDKPTVTLAPGSGLLGYPVYTRRGLMVDAIYDPAFLCGAAIEIHNSLPKNANGVWYPYSIEHSLSSQLPDGPWNTTMQCLKVEV